MPFPSPTVAHAPSACHHCIAFPRASTPFKPGLNYNGDRLLSLGTFRMLNCSLRYRVMPFYMTFLTSPMASSRRLFLLFLGNFHTGYFMDGYLMGVHLTGVCLRRVLTGVHH